jgi:hypothetical protein
MFDIVELQRKLTEARNEIHRQQSEYRPRTAALEKVREKEEEKERQKRTRERDVISLLNEGYNADQASYILDMPLPEVARIEEYNRRRRKFLMTGNLDLPGRMVGITIG